MGLPQRDIEEQKGGKDADREHKEAAGMAEEGKGSHGEEGDGGGEEVEEKRDLRMLLPFPQDQQEVDNEAEGEEEGGEEGGGDEFLGEEEEEEGGKGGAEEGEGPQEGEGEGEV